MRLSFALLSLAVSACFASAAQTETVVGLRQRLDRPPAELGWQVDAAPGNELLPKSGALEIHAGSNPSAFLSRALGVDFVRAEGELKPDDSVATAAGANSLVLYWDADNWCRIAVRAVRESGNGIWYRVEGGGILSGDMLVAGQLTQNRLSACYAHRWHRLALELGEDCVRFLTSRDGQDWVSLLALPRPSEWKGKAPQLLAVGKGFAAERYPSETPVAGQEAALRTTAWVREVAVSQTASERLHLTALEQRELAGPPGRDLLGDAELQARGGPTFESVSRHFPGALFPRELLGLKDHPHAIGVGFDGSLQLKNVITSDYADAKVPAGVWEIGAAHERLGWEPGSCKKSLVHGWMPIVVCRWEHNGLRLEQTAFGYAEGLDLEKPLFAFSRVTVANPTDETRTCALRFRLSPTDRAESWELSLPPRSSQAVYLRVPYSASPDELRPLAADEYERRYAEVERYWSELMARRMTIATPETRVNDASRAWEIWNFLNIHRVDGRFHIGDGTGFYDELFGYSAANQMRAHDYMGYHDDVEKYLESNLTLVDSEGVWVTEFGLPDTPALLVALADHYRLTRKTEWLRRVAPTMIRMCQWIARQRALSRDAPPVAAGLIHYRPYADHPEPVYSYFSDTSLCVAMEATVAVLRDIGMQAEAAPIAAEAAAYRQDILRSMDAAIVEHEGRRYLPIFPVTQGLLKSSDYRADDYYGLVAGLILSTEFLPPASLHAQLLVDTIDNRYGLSLGSQAWRGGIDHAYLYGYLMNELKRGEPDKAVLGLYGWMAYGITRETHSGAEITNHRTGDNNATLPHSYSGARQLLLLRHMLVREDGRNLLLAQASPRHWLAAGKKLDIQNGPTFFGPVGYTIEMDATGTNARVTINPPLRQKPAAIEIFLRHGENLPIRRVTTDGPRIDTFSAESVTLREFSGPVTLNVAFGNR